MGDSGIIMSVSGGWLENGAGEDGFGAKVWKGSKISHNPQKQNNPPRSKE